MNIIDSYRFGLIVVNGRKYTSDVVIFPDNVDNWTRKTGHQLCLGDVAKVITESPEVLVVGSGASGLMRALPEVRQVVVTQGVKFIVEATDKACHIYNQFCRSRRAVAALHITC
ncbi:MTH938/NDUFAF3 family protein [Chloroflexota bacterium]